LISLEQLAEVPFFAAQLAWVERQYPGIVDRRRTYEVVRRMIDVSVSDLIAASSRQIAAVAPRSIDDVRALSAPLIGFSPELAAAHQALKAFLRTHLYRHSRVRAMTDRAEEIITALFATFLDDWDRMPAEHAARARREKAENGAAGAARVVADYVAGMTDRFALQIHEQLVDGR